MKDMLCFIEQICFSILTFSLVHMVKGAEIFPQILTEAHNQTYNLSSTAILTCHVRDLGEHHVTWFKIDPLTSISSPLVVGRKLFTTDPRYSMSFYSTSARDSFWSLEIYQLNVADEGTYLCQIANRRASVAISIHLHIQIPMILYPTYVYTEPGMKIKLNCTVSIDDHNQNRSAITWHFLPGHSNRTNSHDVHIRKKNEKNSLAASLIIEHAQMYHTGTWTCVYRRQRMSARVIVSKGIFKHQRTSALLSNHSNEKNISFNAHFLLLFYVVYKYLSFDL